MVAQHRLNRLARLEARHAKSSVGKLEEAPPSMHEMVVPMMLIAYYLGGLQPDETLQSAVERALTYDVARTAGRRPQVDVNFFTQPDSKAKNKDVFPRLLAIAKTDLGVEGDELNPAIRALFNALPEWCREHPKLAGFEADKFFGNVPNAPPAGFSKRSAPTLNLDKDLPQD